jgi:hypothetical protein
MFHVIEESTVILVAVCPLLFFPLAIPVFKTTAELTHVACFVLPSVLAEAFRFTECVCACINVFIGEDVRTLPMLKAVQPLAFVSVAVLPLVDTVAFYAAVFPLSDV